MDIETNANKTSCDPTITEKFHNSEITTKGESFINRSSINDESTFRPMNNFGNAIRHLAEELDNLGLNYKLLEKNGDKLNLVSLVNCCWELIQLYQSALKDGNAMHDKRRRELADLNFLQGSIRDLRSELEDKERLIQEVELKDRQTLSVNQALLTKFKNEKEEVRRLTCIIQQRNTHHQHELRKKEIENNKLLERLHRLVSGERGNEPRITLSGSLPRSDRARARWKTESAAIRHEEEMNRKVLAQYETWISQLTDEADQLKQCLSDVTSKISKMASKYARIQPESFLDGSLVDGSEVEPLFSLNFVPNRTRIETHLQANLEAIALSLESNAVENRSSLIEDIADLSVSQCSNPCDTSLDNRLAFVVESQLVEKEHELKRQMKSLKEERERLQRERDNFANAAVRLNREKMEFEAEKVELLRCQFLEDIPLTLRQQPDSPCELTRNLADLCGESPQILQSIPSITSPTGNVTRCSQPVYLGTPKSHKHHEERYRRTPSRIPVRSPGGSAPSTRNPSLNRSDPTGEAETPRSKTLERPNQRSRSSVMQRSLPLCSGGSMGRSPLRVSSPRRCLDKRFMSPPRRLASDDSPSIDSGCYSDVLSTNQMAPRDQVTNHRLDALESSLLILLEQVQTRSDDAESSHSSGEAPEAAGSSPCVEESQSKSFFDLLPTRGSKGCESPSSKVRSPERRHTTGDEYLRRIQNNFAKWYSK